MSGFCWTLFKKNGSSKGWVGLEKHEFRSLLPTKFRERSHQISAVCNEMVHALECLFLSSYKCLETCPLSWVTYDACRERLMATKVGASGVHPENTL